MDSCRTSQAEELFSVLCTLIPLLSQSVCCIFYQSPSLGLHLKATLTWIDAMTAVGAQRSISNDLDLAVDNGAQLWKANNNRAPDAPWEDNNIVERVDVSGPPTGDCSTPLGTCCTCHQNPQPCLTSPSSWTVLGRYMSLLRMSPTSLIKLVLNSPFPLGWIPMLLLLLLLLLLSTKRVACHCQKPLLS